MADMWDVLVAILKERSGLNILQKQGWYRIPVKHASRRSYFLTEVA
jgi:hypothetical protein